MHVITLTTVPPRFGLIQPTLRSLLRQTPPADRIILYIPSRYDRFPDYNGSLPDVPQGVEIRRPAQDFGPATKLLPALRDFPTQGTEILFCDDDAEYPQNWAARFRAARSRHPDAALVQDGTEIWQDAPAQGRRDAQPRAFRTWRRTDPAYQWRRILRAARTTLTGQTQPQATRRPFVRSGFVDVVAGYGGVMVRPDFFDAAIFDIPDAVKFVDDFWISGHLARRGVPIWLDAGHRRVPSTMADTAHPLRHSVIAGQDRDAANRRCIDYMRANFGIWP